MRFLRRRGVSEGQQAADAALREAEERVARVTEVVIEMRVLRRQNHFGEAIKAAMEGKQ